MGTIGYDHADKEHAENVILQQRSGICDFTIILRYIDNKNRIKNHSMILHDHAWLHVCTSMADNSTKKTQCLLYQ